MKKNPAIQTSAHDEHDPEIIYGTNQADTITKGGGSQHVIAGNGDDIVSAGGGPDIVEGQNGDDTIRGQGGPDKLFGGNGDDFIYGGQGPDELDGGNGDDILLFEAGMAFDTMTGGRGADVFVFKAGDDHDGGHVTASAEDGGHEDEDHGPPMDTITDFKPGVDKIDFSALEGVTMFSSDPEEYSIWVVQDGDNAIVRVDTNGDVTDEHAAELSVLLLNVDAGSLSVSDFLLA